MNDDLNFQNFFSHSISLDCFLRLMMIHKCKKESRSWEFEDLSGFGSCTVVHILTCCWLACFDIYIWVEINLNSTQSLLQLLSDFLDMLSFFFYQTSFFFAFFWGSEKDFNLELWWWWWWSRELLKDEWMDEL